MPDPPVKLDPPPPPQACRINTNPSTNIPSRSQVANLLLADGLVATIPNGASHKANSGLVDLDEGAGAATLLLGTLIVRTELVGVKLGVSTAGLKLHVAPVGNPEQLSVTGKPNWPPIACAVRVTVPCEPGFTVRLLVDSSIP